MPRSSLSRTRQLALLAGFAIGATLGASAIAAPTVEDSLQGISGSNGRGISGSNGRGISGSNGRGISGSNGRGISGSNGRGISGSNGRGISGSNGRGISGSNGRGISGSNGRSAGSFASGFQVAAMGPLEAVSRAGDSASITVAGQAFSLAAEEVEGLAIGDYVVAGSTAPDAALVYHVGLPYVPGVSSVRVKGPVASADAAAAKLKVGALTIDYVQLLSADPTFAVDGGQTIEAVGVQPASGQVLLVGYSADSLSLVDAQSATANRQ